MCYEPSLQQRPPLHVPSFGSGMSLAIASSAPYVAVIEGCVTEDEAREIQNHAAPRFEASTMVQESGEQIAPARTSKTAILTDHGNITGTCPALIQVTRRLLALLPDHVEDERIESLKVVKYEPGQYFRSHHDCFGEKYGLHKGAAGDRVLTFLIYLNDVPEAHGGSTVFPNLGFDVTPKRGRAVFWYNLDVHGHQIDATLHEGTQLHAGEKLAINLWVRERPFAPPATQTTGHVLTTMQHAAQQEQYTQ